MHFNTGRGVLPLGLKMTMIKHQITNKYQGPSTKSRWILNLDVRILGLFVFCLLLFGALLLAPGANAQGTNYKANPTLCPTEDSSIQEGVSCSGGEKICGATASQIFCFNNATLSPASGSTTESNQFDASFSTNGGHVLDCNSNDGTAPRCDVAGAFLCNRKTECFNFNRVTSCASGVFSSAGASAASCQSGTLGTATGCFSANYNCFDDDGQGANGKCEASSGSNYRSSAATNATYGASCGATSCKSGFIDCDDVNNDPDDGDATGVTDTNGCEETVTTTPYNNAQFITSGSGFGTGLQCGVECQSNFLSCSTAAASTTPNTASDYDAVGCNLTKSTTVVDPSTLSQDSYNGIADATWDGKVLHGASCGAFVCSGSNLDCNGATLGANRIGTNGTVDGGTGDDGTCEQTNSADASAAHNASTIYNSSSGSCQVQCATDTYNENGTLSDGCEITNGASCDPGGGSSGTQVCTGGTGGSCACTAVSVINFQTGVQAIFQTANALLWGRQTGTGPLISFTNSNVATALFELTNAGSLGIGNATPSSVLHADSNAANTTAVLTIENTAGDAQVFRVDATPESAITGSIGDIAIDGTNGKLYIKVSGSATNTGWSEVGGAGASGSLADADSDTRIVVERTSDDDTIRFDLGGTAAINDALTINQTSGLVWNNANNDLNIRFAGDTDANVLVVDASADAVGIGTAAPGNRLHVYNNDTDDIASADGAGLILEQDSTGDAGIQFELTGGQVFSLGIDNSTTNDDFIIYDGATARLTINGSSGDITISTDLTVSGNDIAFGNGETISNATDGTIGFTDGTNTLATITDNGTTGTLSVNTLTLSGTGTLNGLDVIDSTTETTLEGALDIAGDVTGTGLGSVALSSNVVDDNEIVDNLVYTSTLDLTETISGATTDNLLSATLTNTSTSGTQNIAVLDNAASTGTTESILVIDNSDTDTAVTNAIEFIDAGGGFTNLFNNAGTLISSAEFNILDANIDLTSEITGVLPIANGGTNKALTLDAGGIFYSDADSFEVLGAGTSGQLLTSGGTGAPTWTSQGSGNGLDADTLDTIDSLSFLRSDTSDAYTSGTLTFNDSTILAIGTGNDLQFTHNGTNSVLTSATGNLLIDNTNTTGATQIQLGTDTDATAFQVLNNTGTNLFEVDGAGDATLATGSFFQPVYGSDDEIVLYLPFSDTGSTQYDRSPYGNDGTEAGGVACNTTSGKYGSGCTFDGTDDFININGALTNSLATSTKGTWTAWIKPVDATPSTQMSIVAFGDANFDAQLILRIETDGTLRAVANDSGGSGDWALDTDSVSFSDNTWTHVALVQDGTEPVLYVNGIAVAQTFTIDTNRTKWFNGFSGLDTGRIGNRDYNNGGGDLFFNGAIDEVKIYKRALAADEIRTHYLRGSGFGASGAITADKFRIVDTSGTANLILDSTGLGIGTTAPQSLLDVRAAAGSKGLITIASDELTVVDGDILGQIDFNAPLESDGTDAILVGASIWAEADATFSATVNSTELVFATGSSAAATERLRIDSAGNVGIGNAAPDSVLDISGSTSAVDGSALKISSSFGDGLYINIGDGGRGIGIFEAGTLFMGYNTNYDATSNSYEYSITDQASLIEWTTAGDIEFLTKASGSAGTEFTADSRMIIKNTGAVGIGTATPGVNLEVHAAAGTAAIKINADTGQATQIIFHENNALKAAFTYQASDNTIRIFNEGSDRITIDSSGNVGIGDTSPAALLTVGSGDLFQVNSSGIIANIDGVAHTIEDISGDLSLNSAGGQLILADTDVLNIGGLTGVAYNAFSDSGTANVAASDNDVYIEDVLEVDGELELDGTLDADGAADFSGGLTNSAGELLISGGNVQLNDSINLTFGTGDDFTLTHNGTNTVLTSATGNLIIDNTNTTGATQFQLGTDTNATDFQVLNNTGTTLFEVDGSGDATLATGSFFQPVYGSDDELIIYMPFSDTGSTQYDRSPYGNDGTETNGVVCDGSGGKYGRGCTFDGANDTISLPASDPGISNNDFTITGWVNSDDFTGEENSIYNIDADNGDVVLLSAGANGTYHFRFLVRGNDGDTVTQLNITVNNIATAGQWHYYAAVYTQANKTANLYLDGVNVGSATGTYTNFLNGSISRQDIGVSAGGGRFHDGKIDEVKIYKRALDVDEIKAHYLGGSGFGASGVITANKFRIVDTSGTANLILDSTGLGIGTTSPQSLLDVRAAAGSKGLITIASDELTVVDGDILGQIDFNAPLESDGTDAILVGASIWAEADATFSASVNSTDLVFATGSSATATERMRIDSAGNVGIGTAAPGADLHLDDASGLGAGLMVDVLSDGVAGDSYAIIFDEVTVSTHGSSIVYAGADNPTIAGKSFTLPANTLNFIVTDSGTDRVGLSIARATANVGVGTTAPQSLLDVRAAAGSKGLITIASDELTVVDGDILGQIDFNAPLESSGTDAILVGASIWAEADATFSASVNSTDLVFATGSSATATERMRIDSAGNVGIGTATPGNTLHLVSTDSQIVQFQNTGDHARMVLNGSDGNGGDLIFKENGAAQWGIYTGGQSGSATLGFYPEDGATAALLIQDAGNVGISDATPDDLLNLLSTSEAAIAITSTGTDTDAILKFELADGTATFTMGVDDSDSDKFKISTTALGTNDRLVIDSSGNVGIGDTTPAALFTVGNGDLLQVDSSGNLTMNADTTFTIGAGSDFTLAHNGTNTVMTSATGNLVIDNTNTTGDTQIQFGTDTNATSFQVLNNTGTNLFEVDGSGNVGIGDSTPLLTLDVDGSTRVRASATSVLTGTIDPIASNIVTGVGTLFTTELVPGDRITVTGETRTVTAIASATSLTVDSAFTDNANDTSPDKLPAALIVTDSSDTIDFIVQDNGSIGIGGLPSTSPGNKLTIFSGGEEKLKLLNTGSLQLGAITGMSNSTYQLTDYALDVRGTTNFSGALALGATTTYLSYLASDGTVGTFQKISDTAGNFTATLIDLDRFGSSVTSIGDLNGDGVDDLAVGAIGDDDGTSESGAVYILFMNTNGTVASEQKISDTAGNFTATFTSSDNFGISVSPIGDLNGDGITDLAVGASGHEAKGAVYILFMKTDGTVSTHQKISDTDGNLTATLDISDEFGTSVTSIGDLNGDGIGDIAVGARRDDDGVGDGGAVYILFMNTDGTVASEQKISDTAGNFTATLTSSDLFGGSVSSIGDLNGDGVVDLAVSAFLDDDEDANAGAVYILFMNTDGIVSSHQKISDTAGNFTATLSNADQFGSSVSSVGDLNGDGINDLVVGALGDDDGSTDRGAIYILFMNTSGTVSTFQKISDTAGNFTATLSNADQFGFSVSSVGDLNGDGVEDLAVGAYQDDDGSTDRGAIYVLFMNDTSRIRLGTASTERFTITDAGNVGIGTNTPGLKLDVAGSTRVKASATSVLTGAIDPAASTTVTGVGTLFTTELVPGDRITVTGETRTVTAIASATSLTVDSAFTDNANDTSPDKLPAELIATNSSNSINFIIQDNGNVGIGTTSPDATLSVSGDIDLVAFGNRIDFDTDNDTSIRADQDDRLAFELGATDRLLYSVAAFAFQEATTISTPGNMTLQPGTTSDLILGGLTDSRVFIRGGNFAINDEDNNNVLDWDIGTSAFAFQKAITISTTANNNLTITAGGTGDLLLTADSDTNVGIGDTTPDDLLNIHSAAAESAIAITSLGTDTDAIVKFELADGTATFTIGVDDSDSDKFKISTTALGTNDRLVIDSSGNVGIGTASPSELLHLVGSGLTTIRIDGDDTADARIMFRNGGGDSFIFDDDDNGHAFKIESANDFVINTGGTNERIRVASTGLVSISEQFIVIDSGTDTTQRGTQTLVSETDSTLGIVSSGEGIAYLGVDSDADTVILGSSSSTDGGIAFFTGMTELTWPTSNLGSGTEVMTILENGNVGIGDTSPDEELKVVGGICAADAAADTCTTAAGAIDADGAINANNFDLAENFLTDDETLAAGEIVTFDPNKPISHIVRASNTSQLSIGVVSTNPSLVMGYAVTPDDFDESKMRPVALAGRVPVKISTEGGAIVLGDYLTLSSIPGVARKASDGEESIGLALEAYDDDGLGSITMFVNLSRGSGQQLAVIDESAEALDLGDVLGEAVVVDAGSSLEKQVTELVERVAVLENDQSSASRQTNDEVTRESDLSQLVESAVLEAQQPGAMAAIEERLVALEEADTSELSEENVLDESAVAAFAESFGEPKEELVSGEDLLAYTELSEVEKTNYRLWRVVGEVVFMAKTRFLAAVEFVGEVRFGGRVTFADKDLAGLATVAPEDASVAVTFENPYEIVPVVTATKQSGADVGDYYVTNVTTRGFEIKMAKAHEENVMFGWQALVVEDAQVFGSDGSVAGASTDALFGRELVDPLAHEECSDYAFVRGFNDDDDERHLGVDLSKEHGCPVQAVAPGVVKQAGLIDSEKGYVVIVDHYDGVTSYSGHAVEGSIQVAVGDRVVTGQDIMRMGDTGETTGVHLHFGLVVDGEATNPEGNIKFQNPQLRPSGFAGQANDPPSHEATEDKPADLDNEDEASFEAAVIDLEEAFASAKSAETDQPAPRLRPAGSEVSRSEETTASDPQVQILDSELGFVRVRQEPTVASEHIADVTPGESYSYSELSETGWYQIEYAPGEFGWVSGVYSARL